MGQLDINLLSGASKCVLQGIYIQYKTQNVLEYKISIIIITNFTVVLLEEIVHHTGIVL